MVDDPGPGPGSSATPSAAICPWCSAQLPAADAAACPSCGARLVEAGPVEIPGVTAVDAGWRPAPPRKARTFGGLFAGDDDELPLPSESELPALARPDVAVRREMLRLELDARLSALQAEVNALEADDGMAAGAADAPDTGEATAVTTAAAAAADALAGAASDAGAEEAMETEAGAPGEEPGPDAGSASTPGPPAP